MATVSTLIEAGTDATQDFSFYASTSGSISSATDQKHTGPRSAKLSTGAGPTAVQLNTKNGTVADSGSQISVYFRTDTLPAADADIIIVRAGGGNMFAVTLTSGGLLKNTPTGATQTTGSAVISVNTWYRICLSYYVTNTTTFQSKIYVDGVLDSTANAGTLTRTSSTMVRFGNPSTAGTNRINWFDDMYIATGGASSSSQPDTGNILVTSKRPNANGTTNGFTTQIGAGGSGYGSGHSPQVNEQPLSTTNGWSMVGAGSAITEEYNIENLSTGDVDITGKTLVDYVGWLYASSLSSETASLILNNVTSNISLTSSNTLFGIFAASTTYPAGSGTDIGIITATTLTTVSLYECGIVFAYLPSSSSNYTQACTDPLVLQDTVLKSTTRTLTDPVVLVDTVLKFTSRILSQAIVFVDTIIKMPGKVLGEVVTLVDTTIRSIGHVVSETLTLVDTTIKSIARTISEALILNDLLTSLKAKFQTLVESLILNDSITRSIQRTLSQPIILVDSAFKSISRTISEVITLAATFVSQILTIVVRSIGNFVIYSLYGIVRLLIGKQREFTLYGKGRSATMTTE